MLISDIIVCETRPPCAIDSPIQCPIPIKCIENKRQSIYVHTWFLFVYLSTPAEWTEWNGMEYIAQSACTYILRVLDSLVYVPEECLYQWMDKHKCLHYFLFFEYSNDDKRGVLPKTVYTLHVMMKSIKFLSKSVFFFSMEPRTIAEEKLDF